MWSLLQIFNLHLYYVCLLHHVHCVVWFGIIVQVIPSLAASCPSVIIDSYGLHFGGDLLPASRGHWYLCPLVYDWSAQLFVPDTH